MHRVRHRATAVVTAAKLDTAQRASSCPRTTPALRLHEAPHYAKGNTASMCWGRLGELQPLERGCPVKVQ